MNVKSLFQIDNEVVFLNHGSFGACPFSIMEEDQKWQKEMERQPVEFIGRKHAELLKFSREKLAEFVGAKADDLVYVSNATNALNMIAWSIDLKPGDEVLSTNLEYGASDRMWEFICQQKGAKYVKVEIQLPIENEESFLQAFLPHFNVKTKVLFLSMITSSTALYLPLHQLCKMANSKNIISIIDGAHVPGHIPINLETSPFDFFTGNCHKWMCAPKGTAFLYAKKEVQHMLKPLIISWGKEIDTINNTDFINDFEYLGTRDISGFLSVPACIQFLDQYIDLKARNQIHELLIFAQNGIETILKTPSILKIPQNKIQMYAHQLPANVDGKLLKQKLYDDYKIEIPVSNQNGKQYLRISVQIYNTKNEIDFFLDKLDILLKKCEIKSIN